MEIKDTEGSATRKITSYNLHVLGSFPPSLGCFEQHQGYSAASEPTRLFNQSHPPRVFGKKKTTKKRKGMA